MTVVKALIVDDSKVAHLTLRKMLMERSVEVDWVGSGEESLEYLKHQKPDVVFMDIMMPGMDGFETLQAIRADSSLHTPTVVMCSANATSEDRVLADQYGAAAFLTKPYTNQELDTLLADLATSAPSPAETPHPASEPEPESLEAALSRYEAPSLEPEPPIELPRTPSVIEPLEPLAVEQPEPEPDPYTPPYTAEPVTPAPAPMAAAAVSDLPSRAELETLIHDIAESVNRKNAEVMMHASRQASTRAAETMARRVVEERVPAQKEPPITAADLQHLQTTLQQTLAQQLTQQMTQQVRAQLDEQLQPAVQAAVQATVNKAVEQAVERILASEAFGQRLDERIKTTALTAAEGQSRDIANKVVRDMLAEQAGDHADTGSSGGPALMVGGIGLVLGLLALMLAVVNMLGLF